MTAPIEKLKEIEREIALRRRVYPRRVADGKMSPWAAEGQIRIMEDIAEDYRLLASDPVRSRIASMAAAICELDDVQCQCVRAPETRAGQPICDGPFKQAEAAYLALQAWEDKELGYDAARRG